MNELELAPEPEPDLSGRVIAERYELLRLLGRGGMGAVYEARNAIGKHFAMKLLLRPELAWQDDLVNRFFREARASASIESEHIVEVYDTGTDPSTRLPFILMELLRGEDLEMIFERVGALRPTAACRVIAQAALGLADAHYAGIVHRDVKPANIFLHTRPNGEGVVKILDFGIAKHSIDYAPQNQGLTRTGSIMATPAYMSPEQAQGAKRIDGRTDVWSLSMCLYEALAGCLPWGPEVDTLGNLIISICTKDVVPLRAHAPWVPAELERVVLHGLMRDPSQRLGSARQLYEALRPFCEGSIEVHLEDVVRDARPRVGPRLEGFVEQTGTLTTSSVIETITAPTIAKRPSWFLPAAVGAGVALSGILLAIGLSAQSSAKQHTSASASAMPVPSGTTPTPKTSLAASSTALSGIPSSHPDSNATDARATSASTDVPPSKQGTPTRAAPAHAAPAQTTTGTESTSNSALRKPRKPRKPGPTESRE